MFWSRFRLQNYIILNNVAFRFCFSIFPFVQIVSAVFQFVQNLSISFKNAPLYFAFYSFFTIFATKITTL